MKGMIYIASIIGGLPEEKTCGRRSPFLIRLTEVVTNRMSGSADLRSDHVPCLLYFHDNNRCCSNRLDKRQICSVMAITSIGSERRSYGDADEAVWQVLWNLIIGFISYEADQGMDTSAVEAAIDSGKQMIMILRHAAKAAVECSLLPR